MSEKILVVDDEPRILQVFSDHLQNAGYEVLRAASGTEALALFDKERPGIVLTDIRMPSLDGLGLLQMIRERSADTEVILVTGHGDVEIAVEALRAGASDFLNKPVERATLLGALHQAQERLHLKRQLRTAEEALQESEQRLRQIIEQMPYPVEVCDMDGTATMVNQAFLDMFGVSSADLVVGRYNVFQDPVVRELGLVEDIRRVYEGETVFVPEIVVPLAQIVEAYKSHKGEQVITQEATMFPVFRSSGEIWQVVTIWKDITERRRIEKALQQSEQRLRLLVESTQDIVLMQDLEGTYLYYNAAPFCGLEAGNVVGKSPFDIHSPEMATAIMERIKQVAESGQSVSVETSVMWQGEEIWFIDQTSPVRDESGRCVAVVTISRNITERVNAEVALRQYADELEARNRELDVFAEAVAHNLRTPLTTIFTLPRLLMEELDTLPEQEILDRLSKIEQSGRKMEEMIDSLLRLARVPYEEVAVTVLDMAGIVSQALQRISPLIEERQGEIILPPAEVWPEAMGDAGWIEEVWDNYFSNGLKYGGSPPRLELGAGLDQGQMIRFWVRDNGPGLTREDQERLFVPFTRVGHAQAKGYGLGLSIVRRIVEKLGGEVGVESQIGQGSTFWFTLPVPATIELGDE